VVSEAACTAPGVDDDGGTIDLGDDGGTTDLDGGTTQDDASPPPGLDDGGAIDTPPYGPTMSNAEGDDDDCKYHVKWSVASGGGSKTDGELTFTVTVTNKKDNSPVTQAPIDIEAFLDDTHPALNTDQVSTETSTPGTYTVGPVAFDTSGKWTVRFHIHDDCDDSETSPHGHAAFFVQVDVK
jgi:hypothetical protein